MKRNVILSIFLIATGLLLAQPGKPKGPGGQYSERMEMMMIWKFEMCEAAELTFQIGNHLRRICNTSNQNKVTLN